MSTRILCLCLLSLAAVACGEVTTDTPTEETPTAAPAETPDEASDEPAAVTPTAVPEEPVEPTPAPAAPAGDAISMTELAEGFAEDRDAWMGREVTVTALYFSSSSVDGELNNIALKADRESGANYMCAFSDETRPSPAPSLRQYAEVTVTGTVGQFFGSPKIESCRIVSP